MIESSMKKEDTVGCSVSAEQLISTLLPTSGMALRLDQVEISPQKVTRKVTSTQPVVCCPCCGQQARRIQSRYVRHLADLPWGSFQVVIQVTVRRFFCDTAACFRKIFVERLSGTAQAWARRTNRLRDLLLALVMSLG